jgi:hypothetical protein
MLSNDNFKPTICIATKGWRNKCPVHLFDISSSAKCLRVSKTESYGISRICFEMTRQATMPLLSEKCLRVSKTESYGLSRICFEMTRQATMPSSKAWLCLADEQHKSVFAYPKQRATVLVGSVLKWRARPQCLHCQKSVFAYPRQRATVSVGSVLKWRARPQCFRRRRDFVLQMNNTKEVSPKITAQMRTIYVTAQSVQIAGAAESADSP